MSDIKYPDLVRHNGLRYRPESPIRFSNEWKVVYSNPNNRTTGTLWLPVGYQDEDRTYTSQDIYWMDRIDYSCMRG